MKKRPLLQIVFLSSLFWIFFLSLWSYYRHHHLSLQNSPKYHISHIASVPQTSHHLPNSILSTLLNIPPSTSLFSISPEELSRRLLSCPVIKKGHVWQIFPSTLGVEYTLRDPIATIAGKENLGVDSEGTLFPLLPFYPPLLLPTIVPDRSPQTFETQSTLIHALISRLSTLFFSCGYTLTTLDISHINHKSFFRKEIIATFSGEQTLYLRIHPATYSLIYLPTILRSIDQEKSRSGIIDLRYPQTILLSNGLVLTSTKEKHFFS